MVEGVLDNLLKKNSARGARHKLFPQKYKKSWEHLSSII